MSELSVFETQIRKKRKTGIPRLMEIAGTKSSLLVAAALLSIVAVLAQMTPYVTIYLLVREFVRNIHSLRAIDLRYVLRLGWITVAGIGLFGLFSYVASMSAHVAAFNILYEIRKALAAKLARLPMGYFTVRMNGAIKKILSEDVERIELFVAHHITDLVQAAALPLCSLVVLFAVDWRLALGVLVPLPLAFLAQFSMFGPEGMELYTKWQEKLGTMNGTIVEYVRGMGVVKIFNQSVRSFRRFAQDVYAYRDLTIHWIKVSATSFSAFLALLSSCALFVLPAAILVLRPLSGSAYETAVSTVFLFLYVGMGISVPLYKLMRLSSLLVQINTGLVGIDDILEAEEIPETGSPRPPADASIEFDHVTFSYGKGEALADVSFRAEPGSVTALVGPSGGGKTTIANLIGRFWDVDSGAIRIGGVDLRDIPIEKLNDTVSTVFQDVFLFFDTIEENIRMGNERASLDDVAAAAKAARIHEFIVSLPGGYATRIGEGGIHLSGGEQQRIALARAILKNSPIVVLDEATAYADPENEARIQEALSVALKGKTVIIIAHRLYTITDADQILVVDRGRIVQTGRHDELLARGGLYRELWHEHMLARGWSMEGKTQEKVHEEGRR